MAAAKNPKGFKSEKIWREAVTRAVLRLEKGNARALDRLATSLVSKALEGDIGALKEIGDRLDGKPTMQIENTIIDKTAEERLGRLKELLD
jgi:hypothetical protein